jgi:hypothetical protein
MELSPTPNRTRDANVNNNFNTTTNGSFICNNLTVADGITLTIASGDYVEVMNTATTTGSGKIVVQKGGHFVQRCDAKPSSAKIEHEHETRSIGPRDYAYWSSPILETGTVRDSLLSAGMGRMFYYQEGAGGGWRNFTEAVAC